mgnify:CR=1 FL=1
MLYTAEMTLGKRIKKARERLHPKPTQADIAKYFCISDKAVSAWERDNTVPELEKIADLAILLKVPCIWLLKGAGEPPTADALEVAIEDLKPSERAVIDATIKALRNSRQFA